MAKSCSNNRVNVDDVGGGDGKRKVDCDGKADDDDSDNNKADCDDDADGGGGNSKDDGIFENWCVDGKGGDETDDGDEQTESVAGGIAKCSGNSEMEMTAQEMRWGILKETTVSGQKGDIVFTTISKSTGHAVL